MVLKKIEIELQQYGEFKGKYKGKIRFDNGDEDSFTFGLDPDLCGKYLHLISEQAVLSAQELGKKLSEAIQQEVKQIEL